MTYELERQIKQLKSERDSHVRWLKPELDRINQSIQNLQDQIEGLQGRVLALESADQDRRSTSKSL